RRGVDKITVKLVVLRFAFGQRHRKQTPGVAVTQHYVEQSFDWTRHRVDRLDPHRESSAAYGEVVGCSCNLQFVAWPELAELEENLLAFRTELALQRAAVVIVVHDPARHGVELDQILRGGSLCRQPQRGQQACQMLHRSPPLFVEESLRKQDLRSTQSGEIEAGRQAHALLDLLHLGVGCLVCLGTCAVESGRDQILEHLLVCGHDQAVVDGYAQNAALGGRADLDQPAARDTLYLDAVELGLRLAHLLLDGLGRFLGLLQHFFHVHARLLQLRSPRGASFSSTNSASGKAAKAASTRGSLRIRSASARSTASACSRSDGVPSTVPRSTCQRVPVAFSRASRISAVGSSPIPGTSE